MEIDFKTPQRERIYNGDGKFFNGLANGLLYNFCKTHHQPPATDADDIIGENKVNMAKWSVNAKGSLQIASYPIKRNFLFQKFKVIFQTPLRGVDFHKTTPPLPGSEK